MARGTPSRRGVQTSAEYDREVRRLGRADVPSLTTRARHRCRFCGIGLWKKGPPVCSRDVCKESR